MDPDQKAELEKRAKAMGVVVSTFARKDGYMVRVHGSRTTSLVARGPLAAIVAGALDDFEEAS
jgi:hypothetical protein